EEGKLLDKEDLAKSFMSRGLTRSTIKDITGALEDFDRGIEIRERLIEAGKLLDENYFAKTYIYRGVAKKKIEDILGAIKDFDRAIDIRERLMEAGKLIDENDLAKVYRNRGDARIIITDIPGAMDDFKKAIEIREKLILKEIRLDLRGHLYILCFDYLSLVLDNEKEDIILITLKNILNMIYKCIHLDKTDEVEADLLRELCDMVSDEASLPDEVKVEWLKLKQRLRK
ncbi:MAG: hypothetical protein GTN76_03375, partial [Candidatus Aenigmarchaeota archaeon]|nr:hypothetical protein [Candidatus Aenigmarchaeota archaeon]